MEHWFRSLKTELICINEFDTPKQLCPGISGYILQYNAIRPHEALDFQTPDHVYDAVFSDQSIADLDSERLAG